MLNRKREVTEVTILYFIYLQRLQRGYIKVTEVTI